ncbi:MAG: SDR family oxidoreductase [Oligoflexus sp.]
MLIHDALAGKHALVCGASQGIGRACALELARAGARLTLLARQEEALAAVRQDLEGPNRGHTQRACDMGDLAQVRQLLATLPSDVDILICNSGGPAPGPVLDAAPEAFVTAMTQHLLAPQLLVQALVPHMKASGYGRIINIISTSVKIPLPGLGVSNTIRGAVASWSKTLAHEVGPFGITVNNVLPGYTRTQRLDQIIHNTAVKRDKTRDTITEDFLREIPAARFAEPQETAYACVFLASPFASYVNGINLPVDGGRTGRL